MRLLSSELLQDISDSTLLELPQSDYAALPEKVLQFGTGVLLRALPDFFIDAANRLGIFNGRIVVVKSTDNGDATDFDLQDGLYTICIRGTEAGKVIEKNVVSSAISRVLTAKTEWDEILAFATSPDLAVVISNTTEVGLQLVKEDIHESPPSSFPAKLLACLLARFEVLGAEAENGLVVIPTELIPGNGDLLKNILLELAHFNDLDADFISWLDQHIHCCNSLVDRIVPGKPDQAFRDTFSQQFSYQDELLIVSEVYALWAIEGNHRIQGKLSFASAHPGVVIATSIDGFRELKLRILNGGHTLSCGLFYLAGIKTVKEAMSSPVASRFIEHLLRVEIAQAIPYQIDAVEVQAFAKQVLDRFRNPYLEQQWISITLQYSSKMRMRNIPTLLRHYELHKEAPAGMALGFAAYLLFMKAVKIEGDHYLGNAFGTDYWIQDDQAAYFYMAWQDTTPEALTKSVLSNQDWWGTNLDELPGFTAAVTQNLVQLLEHGVISTLEKWVY